MVQCHPTKQCPGGDQYSFDKRGAEFSKGGVNIVILAKVSRTLGYCGILDYGRVNLR